MPQSHMFGVPPLRTIRGNPDAWSGRGQAIEGIVMGSSTDIKDRSHAPQPARICSIELACIGERYVVKCRQYMIHQSPIWPVSVQYAV